MFQLLLKPHKENSLKTGKPEHEVNVDDWDPSSAYRLRKH